MMNPHNPEHIAWALLAFHGDRGGSSAAVLVDAAKRLYPFLFKDPRFTNLVIFHLEKILNQPWVDILLAPLPDGEVVYTKWQRAFAEVLDKNKE